MRPVPIPFILLVVTSPLRGSVQHNMYTCHKHVKTQMIFAVCVECACACASACVHGHVGKRKIKSNHTHDRPGSPISRSSGWKMRRPASYVFLQTLRSWLTPTCKLTNTRRDADTQED